MFLVAHRGFRSPKGENRMVDFKNALKTCKAVEFDIRMTKDKKLIIFHDHHFRRIGNLDQTVRRLTYQEVKEINFFKQNPDYLPPLFIEDFVNKIADQYEMINVEIKPDRNTPAEFAMIGEALDVLRKATKAEIVVSSFSLKALEFITTLAGGKFKKGYLFEHLSQIDFNLLKKFDYLHPYVGTLKLKKNIERIKKINLPLNIWTLKRNEDIEILFSIYGNLINAFISDVANLKLPS